MFYTVFTEFGAFLMLGLYTLIRYLRKSWRWWLPGQYYIEERELTGQRRQPA